MGATAALFPPVSDLDSKLAVWADGRRLRLPAGAEGIIVLNIPSFVRPPPSPRALPRPRPAYIAVP
jgi:hypothetical protein